VNTTYDGFSEELQCFWDNWVFNRPKSLYLYLPDGNCTDMNGCISIAKKLMPEVRSITVFEAEIPVHKYAIVNNKWIFVAYPSKRHLP
jgi:hypothetical protein